MVLASTMYEMVIGVQVSLQTSLFKKLSSVVAMVSWQWMSGSSRAHDERRRTAALQ